MGLTVATWRITPVSEIRNRRRPEVCCGELAAEQSTFGSGQVSAGLPSNRRGPLGERCSPGESTITQLGTNGNPLKTNAQRQSQSRAPSVAVLYSHRVTNVFRSRSALSPTARRPIEHQHSSAPMIALPPAVLSPVRPVRNSQPGLIATGSAPLASAGFKRLSYVNSLISNAKMGSFGQIWAPRQTHSRCTILHNPAQLCTTGVQP